MHSSLFPKLSNAVIAGLLILSAGLSRAADDFAATSLGEMSAGKTKVFKSATIEKSQAGYEISYPASWQVAESPRPSVIVRIGDTNHAAVANFVIAEDRLKSANSSPDQIFTKSFVASLKPSSATWIRGERYKEGTFDGAVTEYIGKQSRAGRNFRLYATTYVFVQSGMLVELQFYAILGENEDKQADDAKVAAFKPLWKAMLATLKHQP